MASRFLYAENLLAIWMVATIIQFDVKKPKNPKVPGKTIKECLVFI